jgi:predicted DNA-binding transcriptional regulator AlpA
MLLQYLKQLSDQLRLAIEAGGDPYLNRRETAVFRGVSVTTLGRMIRRKQFPQGDWISPRKRGWRLSVVQGAPQAPVAPPSGSLAKAA